MRKRTVVVAALAALGLAVSSGLPASAAVSENPRSCTQVDGRVSTIIFSGTTAYLGGSFTKVKSPNGKWVTRNRLAAVNTSTCAVLPWAPTANGEVRALHLLGTTVYVGGYFTTLNGVTRNRLGAVNSSTAALLPFNPNLNGSVRAITSYGGRLFVGGDFLMVGATARNKLAAFYTSSGGFDWYWKPVASGNVHSLAVSPDGQRLYVGGRFTSLAGSAYAAYLGALRPTTAALDTTFLPRPGWPVDSVAVDTRGVYAGGGGTGGHLAIWNANGTLQRGPYVTDGDVQAVAVDGNSLYAGGHFTSYCVGGTGGGTPFKCSRSQQRRKFFEVNLTTGAVTGWSPSIDSSLGIWAAKVEPVSHDLWAGGDFTTVNTRSTQHLAVFP
jgi:hypothetical protein